MVQHAVLGLQAAEGHRAQHSDGTEANKGTEHRHSDGTEANKGTEHSTLMVQRLTRAQVLVTVNPLDRSSAAPVWG